MGIRSGSDNLMDIRQVRVVHLLCYDNGRVFGAHTVIRRMSRTPDILLISIFIKIKDVLQLSIEHLADNARHPNIRRIIKTSDVLQNPRFGNLPRNLTCTIARKGVHPIPTGAVVEAGVAGTLVDIHLAVGSPTNNFTLPFLCMYLFFGTMV